MRIVHLIVKKIIEGSRRHEWMNKDLLTKLKHKKKAYMYKVWKQCWVDKDLTNSL